MIDPLSELAETIPGSVILSISNQIKKRIAEGEKIHNYTVGDFDPVIFPIPGVLKSGIIQAYKDNYTNYPPAEGVLELRRAISKFVESTQQLHFKADEIIVGAGGRPLIYALYRTIVDKGDKVVYPVPSWNNQYYTQFTGGAHCPVHTTEANRFMPTAGEIKPHLKDAVLLALCSPQNPTGTCFTKDGLQAICRLVVAENKRRGPQEKKLYLLYDQMYSLLMLWGNTKHHDPVSVCPGVKKYTIYIDAISKGFASTGVRVGWAMGPVNVLNKMKAILTHVGAWAPMAEQEAVAGFLNNNKATNEYLISFKARLVERLRVLYHGFLKLKAKGLPVDVIEPQAAIYLTVRIDLGDDGPAFLLKEAGLGLLPFAVFGAAAASSWYRLSIGTCSIKDIEPMLQRLENALINYYQLQPIL